MDGPRLDTARVFEEALDLEAEAREAYVRRALAGDEVAVAEVLALLAADAASGDFLATPTFVAGLVGRAVETDDPAPDVGRRIGRYRLCELLGRGGMGSVYLAEREEGDFEQRVAVKILRRGMDTDELLSRFERERRLLARLDHPNIARLLDGGSTDEGRPFLVMEHVEGTPLDRYCEEAGLGVRERLELFLEVCAAVQHAHRNLVVHRDLKPSNILVAPGPDGPRVKLLDFGIAKLLDPDDRDLALTATQVRLLSPRYGSPEQVRGEPVSVASDVYSLGVVLYELLTGASPYADATGTLEEVERRVVELDPSPPSTVTTRTFSAPEADRRRRALRGDLDTIVLEALRKEPERRYGSVEEFAEDVRRHLDGRPVLARRDSAWYRTQKFVRRHAVGVVLASFAVVALLAGTAVSTALYLRADRAQHEATDQRLAAERVSDLLRSVFGAIDPAVARGEDTRLLRRLLADAGTRVDEELADQPEVAAALHHTLGRAYHSLGEMELAGARLRRAVELDPHGPAARMVDLGYFLHEAGEHDEAMALLEAAHARATEEGDVTSQARALYWSGRALELTGSQEDALDRLSRADAMLREAGLEGPRIPVLTGTAIFLVNNYEQYEQADSLAKVALEIVDRIDAGPSQRGQVLQTMANARRRQGDLARADSLFVLARAEYRETFDEDHVQIASLQDEWAGALEGLGRLDEAEALYRASLAGMRRAYGSEHRQVGTLANNLANVLRRTGRHDEAAPLYDEAVRVYRAVLGPDHAWVGIILGNVALNDLARGELDTALRNADECRRVRALHWEEGHWRLAAADMVRGAVLSSDGRVDEGEALLLRSLAVMDSTLGAEAAPTRQVVEQLRDHYRRAGRSAPAAIAARFGR